MDPQDKILAAMAGGPQNPVEPVEPVEQEPAGMEQMAPQQAVELLQGFGISEQDLPMVAMAIDVLMGGGDAQPAV
jgi:hypothetical protein